MMNYYTISYLISILCILSYISIPYMTYASPQLTLYGLPITTTESIIPLRGDITCPQSSSSLSYEDCFIATPLQLNILPLPLSTIILSNIVSITLSIHDSISASAFTTENVHMIQLSPSDSPYVYLSPQPEFKSMTFPLHYTIIITLKDDSTYNPGDYIGFSISFTAPSSLKSSSLSSSPLLSTTLDYNKNDNISLSSLSLESIVQTRVHITSPLTTLPKYHNISLQRVVSYNYDETFSVTAKLGPFTYPISDIALGGVLGWTLEVSPIVSTAPCTMILSNTSSSTTNLHSTSSLEPYIPAYAYNSSVYNGSVHIIPSKSQLPGSIPPATIIEITCQGILAIQYKGLVHETEPRVLMLWTNDAIKNNNESNNTNHANSFNNYTKEEQQHQQQLQQTNKIIEYIHIKDNTIPTTELPISFMPNNMIAVTPPTITRSGNLVGQFLLHTSQFTYEHLYKYGITFHIHGISDHDDINKELTHSSVYISCHDYDRNSDQHQFPQPETISLSYTQLAWFGQNSTTTTTATGTATTTSNSYNIIPLVTYKDIFHNIDRYQSSCSYGFIHVTLVSTFTLHSTSTWNYNKDNISIIAAITEIDHVKDDNNNLSASEEKSSEDESESSSDQDNDHDDDQDHNNNNNNGSISPILSNIISLSSLDVQQLYLLHSSSPHIEITTHHNREKSGTILVTRITQPIQPIQSIMSSVLPSYYPLSSSLLPINGKNPLGPTIDFSRAQIIIPQNRIGIRPLDSQTCDISVDATNNDDGILIALTYSFRCSNVITYTQQYKDEFANNNVDNNGFSALICITTPQYNNSDMPSIHIQPYYIPSLPPEDPKPLLSSGLVVIVTTAFMIIVICIIIALKFYFKKKTKPLNRPLLAVGNEFSD